MITVYVADDGKQFDDEFECKDYEWLLEHPNLMYIKFYDKDGYELTDCMKEDTYSKSEKIVVPTEYAAKDIRYLGDYTGFCCYQDITSEGVWAFDESLGVETFVKVGEV